MAGFRDFVLRGNVVDLAVGVIIGAAFGGVVDSMTKDIISPIIGALGGQPDFAAYKIGAIGVGAFINALINFAIKAAVVYFMIVKPFSMMMERRNPPAKPGGPPPPPEDVVLLTEIRDLLKRNASAGGVK
ncbi:MAG: large conductance mechanosensitive channel protein MscL [Acidobacteriota bacterium]